jgi:hypothetical protein
MYGYQIWDIPLDTDNKDELALSGNEEGVVLLRGALSVNDIALSLEVLLVVLLGALEDGLALLLVGLRVVLANCDAPIRFRRFWESSCVSYLTLLLELGGLGVGRLLVGLLLLESRLGDGDVVAGGDAVERRESVIVFVVMLCVIGEYSRWAGHFCCG